VFGTVSLFSFITSNLLLKEDNWWIKAAEVFEHSNFASSVIGFNDNTFSFLNGGIIS